MSFKTYPQPPFKKFVKTKSGFILEPNYRKADITPACFNRNGTPLFRFGWEISWEGKFADNGGYVSLCDLIVATADTKEELE